MTANPVDADTGPLSLMSAASFVPSAQGGHVDRLLRPG